MPVRQRLADRHQILAAILQPARHRGRECLLRQSRAQRLQIPPIRRPGQGLDLVAGIVDIEFLDHGIARPGQQVCQRVTHHGAAAMADMHGPGRVGRHIFHVDRDAAANRNPTVIFAREQDRGDLRAQRIRAQANIHEARPRGAGLRHVLVPRQRRGHDRRDFRRLAARRLGQDQRRVGRHVAMPGLAIGRDLHPRERVLSQFRKSGPDRCHDGSPAFGI